jgi:hypothetical protein
MTSTPDPRAIIESLGLVPVINAAGFPSRLGGATLAPAVRAAMDAAAQHFVPITEMQERLRADRRGDRGGGGLRRFRRRRLPHARGGGLHDR